MIFYEKLLNGSFELPTIFHILRWSLCLFPDLIKKKNHFENKIWFQKKNLENLTISECYDAGRPSSFDPVCDKCLTMSTQSKPRGRSPLSPTRSHCLRFCDLLNCSFFTAAFFSMISSWSCNKTSLQPWKHYGHSMVVSTKSTRWN